MEEIKPMKRKKVQPAKSVKKTSSSTTTVKRKEKTVSKSLPDVKTEITPEQKEEVLKQCSDLLARLMVGVIDWYEWMYNNTIYFSLWLYEMELMELMELMNSNMKVLIPFYFPWIQLNSTFLITLILSNTLWILERLTRNSRQVRYTPRKNSLNLFDLYLIMQSCTISRQIGCKWKEDHWEGG